MVSNLNPRATGVNVLSSLRLYSYNDFILIVRLDLWKDGDKRRQLQPYM